MFAKELAVAVVSIPVIFVSPALTLTALTLQILMPLLIDLPVQH